MYVLYNMARYSVRVNGETKLLEIERSKNPMPYKEAAAAGQAGCLGGQRELPSWFPGADWEMKGLGSSRQHTLE